MADIEAYVLATRGLSPTTPLTLSLLTPDEVRQLESKYQPKRVLGHL